MPRCTNFEVGDIVKFKKDYYLLLEYMSSGRTFDLFLALYLNNGKISEWTFSNEAFEKVA
jgi:hypothetical protein